MKFIHIADMHFDIPFTTLNKKELGNKRRLEQRELLRKIIEYIKKENIEYLFIAGDLYEHEYIRKSTIEYINNLFKEIPNTKIYITPGNHDPLVKNSFYKNFNWNTNVHVFGKDVEKIDDNNICIYGYGFDNFYMENNKLYQIQNVDKSKINILITHCNLDGVKNDELEYNPISKKELVNLEMDYIALGHIHKKMIEEGSKIIYPGSPISLGFDEQGEHGMIFGEINEENKKINLEFIRLDDKQFVEIDYSVDEIATEEELIEKINELYIDKDKYVKLNLVGNRQFEINKYQIEKSIVSENIIKVKDKTQIELDLNTLKNESSLKGIFVKNMLEKMENEPENKEEILEALEIGLSAM